VIDPQALANEIADTYARRVLTTAPTTREGGLDLPTAYAVEHELVHRRQAEGHRSVGRKVGFANKAVWRALKLETLVWAHMYDDTVRYSTGGQATLDVAGMIWPKIEPEIVFKLKQPIPAGTTDPSAVLGAVEWLTLGFEIIDCPYADWKFQPADFVAAYGLHAALVVGEPLDVDEGNIAALAEALATFRVTLARNGDPVAEGSGRNSLRSPALCLAELAAAAARRTPAEPLAAGELVSSGTLTESQSIAAGQIWTATVDGLRLPSLTLEIHGAAGL
jgi:2-oxo-3-hexenedioate decarboxylase